MVVPQRHEKLHFPEKNPFIPTDFELCERDSCDVKVPSVIKDSFLSRVWFKQDDEYLLPKTSINFEIMSPLAYMDPSHATINYLFVQLFKGEINIIPFFKSKVGKIITDINPYAIDCYVYI